MIDCESIYDIIFPDDFYYENPDNGTMAGVAVPVHCFETKCYGKEYGVVKRVTFLNIIMAIYNTKFREFLMLVFMYNNKDNFTQEDFRNVFAHASLSKILDAKDIYSMNKDEFLAYVAEFLSSIIDLYSEITDDDLMDIFMEFDIEGDPFRFKEGIECFYNFYIRTFSAMIYDIEEKDNSFYFNKMNSLTKILDLKKVSLDDIEKSIETKIDVNDEDNVVVHCILFKMYSNFVVTFHNALFESLVENKYKNCINLKKYIESRFDMRLSPFDRIHTASMMLLNNSNDNIKEITNISRCIEVLNSKVTGNKLVS